MVAIPEPTVLVCAACHRVVTTLRYVDERSVMVEPCGHTAGYTSVPASQAIHGAAA